MENLEIKALMDKTLKTHEKQLVAWKLTRKAIRQMVLGKVINYMCKETKWETHHTSYTRLIQNEFKTSKLIKSIQYFEENTEYLDYGLQH